MEQWKFPCTTEDAPASSAPGHVGCFKYLANSHRLFLQDLLVGRVVIGGTGLFHQILFCGLPEIRATRRFGALQPR